MQVKKSMISTILAFVIGGYVYFKVGMLYGFVVAGAFIMLGWYWKNVSESGSDIPKPKEKNESDDFELSEDEESNQLTLEDL